MRRVVSIVIACSAGLALWASTAAAQDRGAPPPPSPEQMQAQMNMMGPAMATMTESMYTGMLRAIAKPESAEQLATFMKNYRDALVAKGFTREEALQIVRGTGMPSMPSR
jgi:hypothetical protein